MRAFTVVLVALLLTTGGFASANELVAWYPFSGNALDASGYGNDGTVHQAVLTPDCLGSSDRAYAFNGTDADIEVADDATLRPSALTIACWVYVRVLDDPSGGDEFVGKQYQGNDVSYALYVFSDPQDPRYGKVGFSLNEGSSNPENGILISDRQLGTGAWHHIAGTYDGSTMRLFLDGDPAGTLPYSLAIVYDGGPMVMGAAYTDGHLVHMLDGDLDEVRLYDYPLDESAISDLAGSCAVYDGLIAYYPFNESTDDESDYRNPSTGYDVSFGEYCDGTSMGIFNGASSRVSAGDAVHLHPGQVTVAAMVRLDAVEDESGGDCVIRKTYLTNDASWTLDIRESDRRVGFHVNAGSGNPVDGDVVSVEGLALDHWYHVAGTYDGSTLRLYIDGQLTATEAYSTPIVYDGGELTLGAIVDGGGYLQFLDGSLADLRVYGYALSQQEIEPLATPCPTPVSTMTWGRLKATFR